MKEKITNLNYVSKCKKKTFNYLIYQGCRTLNSWPAGFFYVVSIASLILFQSCAVQNKYPEYLIELKRNFEIRFSDFHKIHPIASYISGPFADANISEILQQIKNMLNSLEVTVVRGQFPKCMIVVLQNKDSILLQLTQIVYQGSYQQI